MVEAFVKWYRYGRDLEKRDTETRGLAGLPVSLDLMHVMGSSNLIGHHLQVILPLSFVWRLGTGLWG